MEEAKQTVAPTPELMQKDFFVCVAFYLLELAIRCCSIRKSNFKIKRFAELFRLDSTSEQRKILFRR